MPIHLTQLQPLVGTSFEVSTLHGIVRLTLVEAVGRPRRGLPSRFMRPLSMVLQGPADIVLSQDSYHVYHQALGEHLWSMVRIAPSSVKGYETTSLPLYEVTLSQLNPAVVTLVHK